MDSINPQLLRRNKIDEAPQDLVSCPIQNQNLPEDYTSSFDSCPFELGIDELGELTQFQEKSTAIFLETSSLTDRGQTINVTEANCQPPSFQPLDCPLNYFTTTEQEDPLDFDAFMEFFEPHLLIDPSETITFSSVDMSQFRNQVYSPSMGDLFSHQEFKSQDVEQDITGAASLLEASLAIDPLPKDYFTSHNRPKAGPEAQEPLQPCGGAIAKLDDKRERNNAASARFRIKSKKRQNELKMLLEEKTSTFKKLESRMSQLQLENRTLREHLVTKRKLNEGEGPVEGNTAGETISMTKE